MKDIKHDVGREGMKEDLGNRNVLSAANVTNNALDSRKQRIEVLVIMSAVTAGLKCSFHFGPESALDLCEGEN